jgi:hypothetical protein
MGMVVMCVIAALRRVVWDIHGDKVVIDRLVKEWLGRKGVIGIGFKEVEGEAHIVFYVLPPFRRDDYPYEAYGYRVVVEPSGPVYAL